MTEVFALTTTDRSRIEHDGSSPRDSTMNVVGLPQSKHRMGS